MSTNIENDISAGFKFIMDPVHIIMTLIIVGLLCFGIYSIEARRADLADARATASEQAAQIADKKAADAVAQNTQYQQQVTTQIDQLTQQNVSLQQTVSTLIAAQAARDAGLKKQQSADSALTPSQLASRWQTVGNLPDAITVAPDGKTYIVTPNDALTTTQMLESLPIITKDLADERAAFAAEETKYNNEVIALALEKQAHTSDITTSTTQLAGKDADIKALKDELAKTKADCKKSKFKWGTVGIVIGYLLHFIK